VPTHSHENEQITYILEGALHFWLGPTGDREVTVRAGEVWSSRRILSTAPWRWRRRSTSMSSIRRGRIWLERNRCVPAPLIQGLIACQSVKRYRYAAGGLKTSTSSVSSSATARCSRFDGMTSTFSGAHRHFAIAFRVPAKNAGHPRECR